MQIKNLKKNFINYCKKNKFEVNTRQVKVIELLTQFYKKLFLQKFYNEHFSNKKNN